MHVHCTHHCLQSKFSNAVFFVTIYPTLLKTSPRRKQNKKSTFQTDMQPYWQQNNSTVAKNTRNIYLLMTSSESTCLLNGFGYRLQKALLTWSQLNLKTPEYIYKLPHTTFKVLIESCSENYLLEHTICTVELHLDYHGMALDTIVSSFYAGKI